MPKETWLDCDIHPDVECFRTVIDGKTVYRDCGDACETCHALIEGGNAFSRYCDSCLDSEAN